MKQKEAQKSKTTIQMESKSMTKWANQSHSFSYKKHIVRHIVFTKQNTTRLRKTVYN